MSSPAMDLTVDMEASASSCDPEAAARGVLGLLGDLPVEPAVHVGDGRADGDHGEGDHREVPRRPEHDPDDEDDLHDRPDEHVDVRGDLARHLGGVRVQPGGELPRSRLVVETLLLPQQRFEQPPPDPRVQPGAARREEPPPDGREDCACDDGNQELCERGVGLGGFFS